MKSAVFAIGIIVAALLLTAFVMNSGKTTAPSPGHPHSTHPVYCQPGPNPDC